MGLISIVMGGRRAWYAEKLGFCGRMRRRKGCKRG
jgi:hypothetical protein